MTGINMRGVHMKHGLVLVSLVCSAQAIASQCPSGAKPVGKCYSVRGEIGTSNGTPSTRIWIKGGHVLGVRETGNEKADIPAILELKPDKTLAGVFQVCPTSPKQKGAMQLVCVESYSLTPPKQ